MIPETLDELTKWVLKQKDAYGALALHSFVSSELQVDLEKLMFEDKRTKLIFASAHYTPDSVLDRLIVDHSSEILDKKSSEQLRTRVVKHPNTSTKTLERIYRQDCPEYLKAMIATHRNTAADVLLELDWQGSDQIRLALCGNPNTPLEQLRKILSVCCEQERKLLVKHPELDGDMLATLWEEGDQYLRAEVVAHPNCPIKLIGKAIDSPEMLIRKRLASNPSITEPTRYRLLQDAAPQVRAAVVNNLETHFDTHFDIQADGFTDEQLLALCEDPSPQVRRNEAKRPELSDEVIEQLAADNDVWVRRWLARNAQTSEARLEQLTRDEDEHVRRSVARNAGCPEKLLVKLAKDKSSWVRAGVALRSDIPESCLIELAREENVDVRSAVGKNPVTPVRILDEITQSDNRDIRRSVILNREVTASTLEKLQEDPYPLNRIILGSKAQCSQQTRWALANDPDPEVRFSAIRTAAKQLSL